MSYPISEILIQLCRAHRRIAESRLNAIGLHAGQEAILLHLVENEGVTQTELAGRLGVEAPTITKAVTRLEKSGFVARRPDPDDGRVSRVYLTTAGKQLEREIHLIWATIERQLLEDMSEAERVLLQRLLPHMADNLRATGPSE